MIDRIANFFKPNQEKPEIAAINSSMDSLEKSRQVTPSLPGFLINFYLNRKVLSKLITLFKQSERL